MIGSKSRISAAKRSAKRQFDIHLEIGEKVNYKQLGEILNVGGSTVSSWYKEGQIGGKREDIKKY